MKNIKSACAEASNWIAMRPLWIAGLVLFCASAQGALKNIELARQLNQAFVDLAEKVSPTVAVINVIQTVKASEDDDGAFEYLPPGLRDLHKQLTHPDNLPAQGSGIIIRENGYILTNTHVVEDADTITVRLQDGRSFKATVRGIDPQSDIAVIKIDAHGLPVATWADSSKTRVGEFAIAIGAPFSLDYSVTFGHVSAKSRTDVVEGREAASMDQDFIQTDALINPGNSGGPLVDIDGEVIGINTLIRGLHTGIGFAIPSNFAKEVAEQLISEGRYQRAWLGIGIRALRDEPDLRELIKASDDGVVVSAIMPDGPSARSELKPGDIITAVDGTRVATPQQLRTAVRHKKVGQPITLDLIRKGKTTQVKVSPGEWQQPSTILAKAKHSPTPPAAPANLGLTVKPLTPELAAQLASDTAEGVVVATVEKDSPADRKGIKPGDLITSVNQQPVDAPKQFQEAVKGADLKKGVIVNVLSGNLARFEILKAE